MVGITSLLAVAIGWLWPGEPAAPPRPSLSSVPPGALDRPGPFPGPEPDLPVATPLAPLLAADRPDALSVLSPGEGATRVRRGASYTVRFNRPMVPARRVGRETEALPLRFTPPLTGAGRWASRSRFVFRPDDGAFGTAVREVRVSFAEDLSSLGGEPLVDDLPRLVVLDGAPRLLTHRSSGRVRVGQPLPLFFDAPVPASEIDRVVLAYEVGGGQRTLPVRLRAASRQPEDGYRLDALLRRPLEPGAEIALVLPPRYLPWGGRSPATLTYQLAPRPRLEGVACRAGAAYANQCDHRARPGRILDIASTLRVLASAPLAQAPAVRVHPPVRNLEVALAPHGPPRGRLVSITAEWAPDQVYELRLGPMRTPQGERVRDLGPLAVRSAGHAPSLRVAGGRRTWEAAATRTVALSAIHPDAGTVRRRPVPPGDELAALASYAAYLRGGADETPLAPWVPDARANRWAEGRVPWSDDGADLVAVAFRAGPRARPTQGLFQATDLAISARAQRGGLLAWVTRLSTGAPVSGARVAVGDAEGARVGEGRTDADGVALLELATDPTQQAHGLLVRVGDERATLWLDPRRSPHTEGRAEPRRSVVGEIVPDRGAYRPGERLRAMAVLRRVEGASASAVTDGTYVVTLRAPSRSEPLGEARFRPDLHGRGAVTFVLPPDAELGTWRLAARLQGSEEALASTSVRVAAFRQPTFRVDLALPPGRRFDGDALRAVAAGTYLFGAPVDAGRARWTLRRLGASGHGEAGRGYTFVDVDAERPPPIAAAGEAELDGASVPIDAALRSARREGLELEVAITDEVGHTHAARRRFGLHPAAIEVGLRTGPRWLPHGTPLTARTRCLDAADAVAPCAVDVTFEREGWHGWWEWGRGEAYRRRRSQRRERVHACRLEGADGSCAHRPRRPGTYLVTATVEDAEGRRHRASRRVYLAGPDEHPDRDPPGAPIAVTVARGQHRVGERAEVAFEAPWAGRALVAVEGERVLHREVRTVGAGGQTLAIPLSAAMVPSASVSVTLVRGRTGPPAGPVDHHAPDLRFGRAAIEVRPRRSGLSVELDAPEEGAPGRPVDVGARVLDAAGRPVRDAAVTLWAVDEGTLRLTGYEAPDPLGPVFRPVRHALAWDDLRRGLESRVGEVAAPRRGGDGGGQGPPRLDVRERFDPTPLWAATLVTDRQGRVRSTFVAPDRPTEYRLMGVAFDDGLRSGRASRTIPVRQALVVRPAFPRFLTEGDRFEARSVLHNATEAPLTATVETRFGGVVVDRREVTVPASGHVPVAVELDVPTGPTSIDLSTVARAGPDVAAEVRETLPVTPRGRRQRALMIAGGLGQRTVALSFPEGARRARGRLEVAPHPFVALDGVLASLTAAGWEDTESRAGALLARAALAELGAGADDRAERDAAGRDAVAALLRLQRGDGAFGRWSADDPWRPVETALAAHALLRAQGLRWTQADEPVERAVGALRRAVETNRFLDRGHAELAFALRVLREAGRAHVEREEALLAQRPQLSVGALAELALALGPEDGRGDTLALRALELGLADREDEGEDPRVLRSTDRSPRTLAAFLEVASTFEVARARAGEVAAALLGRGRLARGVPYGRPAAVGRVLTALAAYARLYDWPADGAARAFLDGDPVEVRDVGARGSLRMRLDDLTGAASLRIEGADDGPVFFAVGAEWIAPLGPADEEPRGAAAALHRVYETPDGRRLEDGEAVEVGRLVRVRLFVHSERDTPPLLRLRDPMPAGFEPLDGGLDDSPRAALQALLGTGPNDEADDARAHHALRTLRAIARHHLGRREARWYFDRLPPGLSELTYALRATTAGTFAAPPAQLEALHDPTFEARSTLGRLTVTR
jgi:uncharacterized protein YfaS (alpha-2-macroglobulin family)